ncbi:MAG TPA: thiamine pyrophosphate-requiring protein [Methylomirabilota bacterium]|jgi:acetolactate synthase-1/2/3 large subunit|nr:thiamine pyrophosphate-requiring protein [Methylomirabilota bacterium]
MGSRTLEVETTAEAYLALLKDRGIDVFLGNAGTDFASLVEAFARFETDVRSDRAPRPIVVPHEFVAVSMAHGYYAAGGRPAAVMVHVNVGTGNASTAIITASRANIPILMSAGRTPITEEGLPGARDLHIHWAQESFDQAAMLREYVKWDYELRTPVQLEAVVDRALELMHAEPRGPVYLTLPREVLAARPGPMTITSPSRRQSRGERFPDPARIDEAARILARAEHPIILTSAAGLDPRAVAGLVEVAEAGGLGVVEADPIYMNFPHRHDLHLGYNASGTTNPSLGEADAVMVVEADVPWYPALKKPPVGAPIIHLGVDPFFSRYPMRSYPCDVPIAATPAAALPILAEAVRRHADPNSVARRRERFTAEHRARHAAWEQAVLAQASASTIGFAWASRCIGELVDDSTVVVNEYPLDRRFAALSRPGSYFGSPHSSGLGFGLGAALGVKLARPEATVIATVGDGAYFFGEPLSCLFVQRAQQLPILTVIFNNQQWEAVKSGTVAVHPSGVAKTRGRFPLSDLTPSPRFEEMARTVDGHGERVESPGELGAALKRGLAAVREGRPAILNVLCQRAV